VIWFNSYCDYTKYADIPSSYRPTCTGEQTSKSVFGWGLMPHTHIKMVNHLKADISYPNKPCRRITKSECKVK